MLSIEPDEAAHLTAVFEVPVTVAVNCCFAPEARVVLAGETDNARGSPLLPAAAAFVAHETVMSASTSRRIRALRRSMNCFDDAEQRRKVAKLRDIESLDREIGGLVESTWGIYRDSAMDPRFQRYIRKLTSARDRDVYCFASEAVPTGENCQMQAKPGSD